MLKLTSSLINARQLKILREKETLMTAIITAIITVEKNPIRTVYIGYLTCYLLLLVFLIYATKHFLSQTLRKPRNFSH